jgi:hypothetical protein
LIVVDLVLVGIVFLTFGWIAWNSFQGLPTQADPALRNLAPTPMSQPGPRQDGSPLQEVTWLTPEEAAALRSQENVINLVLIEGNNPRYAQGLTIILDDSWSQVQPLKVSRMGVQGTSISLTTASGEDFVFNMYQPFVFTDMPTMVHLVDQEGRSWSKQLLEVTIVSLEEGRQSLPVTVNVNPQLSFSN